MQKETYFAPSSIKNIEELTWLNKSNTNFLWVYQENIDQKDFIEDMLIDKLIQNPRVVNATLNDVSVLKYTGRERFHFLKKHFPIQKVVLFGIEPQDFGIHMNFPKYQIIPHLDYHFLKLDDVKDLSTLGRDSKIALAQSLQQLKAV